MMKLFRTVPRVVGQDFNLAKLNGAVPVDEQTLTDLKERNRELESANRILSYQNRHTQTILLSISDGIIVTNPYGELILANPSAEALLDFSAEKLRGAKVCSFLKEKDLIEVIEDAGNHHVKLKNRSLQLQLHNGAKRRIMQVEFNSVFDEEQNLIGLVTVLRDVTREREVNELKTDFVNHVSHQLRSPLTSIKAYTEMLLDNEGQDPKLQREFLQTISSETEHLSHLINNLLDLSRIEAGGLNLNLEPVNLSEVLNSGIKSIAPLARLKELTIEKEIEVLPPILLDKDLIRQVFINLLSNAVKYTRAKGKVTISTGVNEQEVWFFVRDTGMGIDPKEHRKIFEKFYRSNHQEIKGIEGSGLGLALVMEIVELHKGNISVESSLGKGAVFKVAFPRG
jgi:two-component system phosphate regulon sensor histidine kinase PhoR